MDKLTTTITKTLFLACFLTLPVMNLNAQTIAEKKAGIVGGGSELSPELQRFLVEVNREVKERREQLSKLQDQVTELFEQGAPPESFQALLAEINDEKENIRILQESWRELASASGREDEGYALWHQPETTLEQLIIDYGSLDYVYLVSPDIANIQLSVSSNIPIPHSSWGEMLEQILLQNGVGIKELNPFLRQLYLVREDLSNLRLITTEASDLDAFPGNARVSFVLSPEPMDLRRIWYFLEKFANPNTTVLQRIGRVILIAGDVSSVKDLLRIYDFVSENKRNLEYKTVPLTRVNAEEMTRILSAIFQELIEDVDIQQADIGKKDKKAKKKAKTKSYQRGRSGGDVNALNVIALPDVAQAVFLIGTTEEIAKAEEIIHQVESQVGEARDRTVFWYQVKHSDPEELADILQRIYNLMMESRIQYQTDKDGQLAKEEEKAQARAAEERADKVVDTLDRIANQQTARDGVRFFEPPYYEQGQYVVNPRPIGPRYTEEKEYNKGRDNFIIDPKTGSLAMVVESDLLPKLQEMIKKLDVPKKMVQIEVLLFERRLKRDTSYGLNILNFGGAATQQKRSESAWSGGLDNCLATPKCSPGILDFFFSREKSSCGFPAFDFAYQFLMTQDDITLNASPSVVTLNQTEARISIQDEVSIKTGTTLVSEGSITGQDNFTRAQFGIDITVTPTVHMPEEEDLFQDPTAYVTLVSRINFDSFAQIQTGGDQQPDVIRRQVLNEVRIPDGQTVIIGGLRRKQSEDGSTRIPFLGEIPGLGKLFSTTAMSDDEVEMILFMTPKIISEPSEDFARLRSEELCRRPGDIPCYMCKLNEALEDEKNRLFQGYLSIMLGRPNPRYICDEGEYDGR